MNFGTFGGFGGKSKNARAEISRKTHRRMPRDLSYETDSGPKTKTDQRDDFIICSHLFILSSHYFHMFGNMAFSLCSIPDGYSNANGTRMRSGTSTNLLNVLPALKTIEKCSYGPKTRF